jgi:hypothetical protein
LIHFVVVEFSFVSIFVVVCFDVDNPNKENKMELFIKNSITTTKEKQKKK